MLQDNVSCELKTKDATTIHIYILEDTTATANEITQK